jgi:hypothetical protein
MKTFSEGGRHMIKSKVASFCARELLQFRVWIDQTVRSNPLCYIIRNPPNHSYDLVDGSFSVNIVSRYEDIKELKQREKAAKNNWWSFEVVYTGRFLDIFAFVQSESPEDRRQLVLALLRQYNSGLLWNCAEVFALRQTLPMADEDNPFYDGVAEVILNQLHQKELIQ